MALRYDALFGLPDEELCKHFLENTPAAYLLRDSLPAGCKLDDYTPVIVKLLQTATEPKHIRALEASLREIAPGTASLLARTAQEERLKARRQARRQAVSNLAARFFSGDRAFKLAVLILWCATLAAWYYRQGTATDGRYVYNGGTMFDKRTGTLYRLEAGRWVVVAPSPQAK